ncbi:hypothetical protein ABC766_00210 [Methylobacterium fujisawaense]|uniref:DUF7241 domain-containing protein n=1 Tax=Methylobacterium fujisawaense TaxID=107400 RepID=UPI0031F4C94D
MSVGSTFKDRRPAPVICRERGWSAGTFVVGGEGAAQVVILITAVGEEEVLARGVSFKGKPVKWFEGQWNFYSKDWQQVPDPFAKFKSNKEA